MQVGIPFYERNKAEMAIMDFYEILKVDLSIFLKVDK